MVGADDWRGTDQGADRTGILHVSLQIRISRALVHVMVSFVRFTHTIDGWLGKATAGVGLDYGPGVQLRTLRLPLQQLGALGKRIGHGFVRETWAFVLLLRSRFPGCDGWVDEWMGGWADVWMTGAGHRFGC